MVILRTNLKVRVNLSQVKPVPDATSPVIFNGIGTLTGDRFQIGAVALLIKYSKHQIGDIKICDKPSKPFETGGKGFVIYAQNRKVTPLK